MSLVRVTGASTTVGHRSRTKLLCASILASPAANNIATDFTVLKSVVLTRPNSLVKFTNPEIVRRAVNRGLPRNFREPRFLLRRKFLSKVIRQNSVQSILSLVLGLRSAEGYCKRFPRRASTESFSAFNGGGGRGGRGGLAT